MIGRRIVTRTDGASNGATPPNSETLAKGNQQRRSLSAVGRFGAKNQRRNSTKKKYLWSEFRPQVFVSGHDSDDVKTALC